MADSGVIDALLPKKKRAGRKAVSVVSVVVVGRCPLLLVVIYIFVLLCA